ncbi:hypothetical protein [Catelliglobosispora koreensis]|uniref:hypothetical protein n=1 Tax=Catelliglobosispora koreensis TaxID=129052 RepID=UPI000368E61B|nr:hypothetical protein [Catelliglobosispora koreensis]
MVNPTPVQPEPPAEPGGQGKLAMIVAIAVIVHALAAVAYAVGIWWGVAQGSH